jgi:hypothetical protein
MIRAHDSLQDAKGLAVKIEATIDAEEFLRREETSPLKHEYLAGAVHTMAGALDDFYEDVEGVTA